MGFSFQGLRGDVRLGFGLLGGAVGLSRGYRGPPEGAAEASWGWPGGSTCPAARRNTAGAVPGAARRAEERSRLPSGTEPGDRASLASPPGGPAAALTRA